MTTELVVRDDWWDLMDDFALATNKQFIDAMTRLAEAVRTKKIDWSRVKKVPFLPRPAATA